MTTKEEIMAISLRLFVEEGFENTGVARIVSEAGVTKPTLYHHFGNKDGVLEAILDAYGNRLIQLFDTQLIYDQDVNESLYRLTRAYMGFVKNHQAFFMLYKQLYQSPLGSDSFRMVEPFYESVVAKVEAFFRQVASHHTNLSGKEAWMAYSLLGLLDTYLYHHGRSHALTDLEEGLSDQVAKQFLYGVFSV